MRETTEVVKRISEEVEKNKEETIDKVIMAKEELMEFVETMCKDRYNVLQLHGERVRTLTENEDGLVPGKVRKCERDEVNVVNEDMPRFGKIKFPGFVGYVNGAEYVASL